MLVGGALVTAAAAEDDDDDPVAFVPLALVFAVSASGPDDWTVFTIGPSATLLFLIAGITSS